MLVILGLMNSLYQQMSVEIPKEPQSMNVVLHIQLSNEDLTLPRIVYDLIVGDDYDNDDESILIRI